MRLYFNRKYVVGATNPSSDRPALGIGGFLPALAPLTHDVRGLRPTSSDVNLFRGV